jgi:hypothetical protein
MKKIFIEVGSLTFLAMGAVHWLSLFSSPKTLIAAAILSLAGVVAINFHLPPMDIRHRIALSVTLLALFLWAAKGASFAWFL